MFFSIRSFVRNYTKEKFTEIQSKINYSNTMTLICIGLIVLCGLLLIPFLTRLNQRMFLLMRTFFRLEKQMIMKNLAKIQQFQTCFKVSNTNNLSEDASKIKIRQNISVINNQIEEEFKEGTSQMGDNPKKKEVTFEGKNKLNQKK